MKSYLALLSLALFMTSCKKELVKLEFTSSPTQSESGNFNKSSVYINKTITKSDVVSQLNLDPYAELKSVKVKYAEASLTINENSPQADSVRFWVKCDAIPLVNSYTGTVAVKKGTQAQNSNATIKLGLVKLEYVYLINTALDKVVKEGKTIEFRLEGYTIPGGSTIVGTAKLNINFDVVYHKCIEAHELLILTDAYQGPCD